MFQLLTNLHSHQILLFIPIINLATKHNIFHLDNNFKLLVLSTGNKNLKSKNINYNYITFKILEGI